MPVTEKYLITGGSGQLGSAMRDVFADTPGAVLCRCREGFDVTRREVLETWLPAVYPGAVVNCAGYTDRQRAESSEEERQRCWAVNVTAVARLARVCSAYNIAMVHISDAAVFGGDPERTAALLSYDPTRPNAENRERFIRELRYAEDDCACPLGVYAQSKVAAEHAILGQALENPNFQYYIIRTGGLFAAPSQVTRNYVYRCTELFSRGESATIVADKDSVANITYAPQLAAAIRWMLENRNAILENGITIPSGIYHITNKGGVTLHDVAQELWRLFGRRGRLLAESRRQYCAREGLAAAIRPVFAAISCSKYRQLAGPQLPEWSIALEQWAADYQRLYA